VTDQKAAAIVIAELDKREGVGAVNLCSTNTDAFVGASSESLPRSAQKPDKPSIRFRLETKKPKAIALKR
jgi:hypothetical protein